MLRTLTRPTLTATAAVLALGLGACGTSSGGSTTAATKAPEVNPAGDIPDNQAYVPYAVPGAGLSVKVPEGWSRTSNGATTTFTDKLNGIAIATTRSKATPTVASVRQSELPQLAKATPGYKPGTVTVVRRHAGPAVRITYLADGHADPVTGKTRTDAVERYLFDHKGRELVLTLSGPKGADNVDPWKLVTDSVRWTR